MQDRLDQLGDPLQQVLALVDLKLGGTAYGTDRHPISVSRSPDPARLGHDQARAMRQDGMTRA
ncbi:hypothetical protein GCM10009679_32100 [Saccharothrix algeriensis]|uniref:Uncharacterized protein n=1 Tax=Catellatospora bangladeshensis TaxID=310355 RepID=A0A8J3JLR5_9ACTN|nr:hypothetical protein Cba03nite_43300 [Catellatospora bangladeshensis]